MRNMDTVTGFITLYSNRPLASHRPVLSLCDLLAVTCLAGLLHEVDLWLFRAGMEILLYRVLLYYQVHAEYLRTASLD